MNTPNKLTVARIACAFVLIAFLLLRGGAFAWLAFVLFVAASLTDLLDGRIARATGQVTVFGKFMDPLADKILNYAVMILLIPEGLVPALAAVLILIREFLVAGIRQSGAEQGVVIAANNWGKAKTFVQDVSLGLILFLRAIGGLAFLPLLSNLLLWLCAALTVISGVIYVAQNAKVLQEK